MRDSCSLGDHTCYEIGGFRWEYMGYYCNECKKTISAEEFFYSMNRYNKALCTDHQRSTSIRGTTKDLQDLVRERHHDELIQEIPVLKTVKDWIHADFETWEKVLKNKDEGSYSINVSGEEVKNSSSKRSKK
jgi:hypothetical protein